MRESAYASGAGSKEFDVVDEDALRGVEHGIDRAELEHQPDGVASVAAGIELDLDPGAIGGAIPYRGRRAMDAGAPGRTFAR